MKTTRIAVRFGGGAVLVIGSLRTFDRRWLARPHPLHWLREVPLDRRLRPYSALDDHRPLA